jgi:hypothetical protein
MPGFLPDWNPHVFILYICGAVGLSVILYLVFKVNQASQKKNTRFINADFIKENDEFPVKKSISPELIFVPDISVLPVKDYGDDGVDPVMRKVVSQRQTEALKRAAAKMIKFDKKMTNDEIKEEFGYANLEVIAGYETNFERYTQALLRWAQALFDNGERGDAALVLEASVADGAELSKCYTLLADIYYAANNGESLRKLHRTLETREMPAKNKALKHIGDMLRKGG